jgi:pre-mRNA-splicing factor ISY1
LNIEWEEAYTNLRETLGLPTDDPIPKIPLPPSVSLALSSSEPTLAPAPSNAKRKASTGDGATSPDRTPSDNDSAKRSKKQNGTSATTTTVPNTDARTKTDANAHSNPETVIQYANTVAGHITFLDAESLLPPKMLTREEMEEVLLSLRKKALVEEYFGDGDQ